MKTIILENIRSLHNVGSIFRTADSAGVKKIFLTGYTGAPPDRRIEKVSLGAEAFMDWEKGEDPVECVKRLKLQNYLILALEQTSRAQNIFEFDPKKNLDSKSPKKDLKSDQESDAKTEFSDQKIALILGNEVEGVSTELLQLSDAHLEIPMYGQKGSMNVSVAAGIAFYQIFQPKKT